MNRREMLRLSAAGLVSSNALLAADREEPQAATSPAGEQSSSTSLPLEQFLPKSMLHATVTEVPRSRYPVIDFHTHLTFTDGLSKSPKIKIGAQPEDCLAV